MAKTNKFSKEIRERAVSEPATSTASYASRRDRAHGCRFAKA